MKDHCLSQFKVMLVWPENNVVLTSLRGRNNDPPLNMSRFSMDDSDAYYAVSCFMKYCLF